MYKPTRNDRFLIASFLLNDLDELIPRTEAVEKAGESAGAHYTGAGMGGGTRDVEFYCATERVPAVKAAILTIEPAATFYEQDAVLDDDDA